MTHIILIPHDKSLLEQGGNGERPPKAWLGQDAIWRIFNAWKEGAPAGPEALIIARDGEAVQAAVGWLPPRVAEVCVFYVARVLGDSPGALPDL